MPTSQSAQLDAVSHRAQRRLLVGLLHQNHQDDTQFDTDSEPADEELEVFLDYQHYHLPQLESKGFIEYDRDQHIISKGPHFEEIEPLINLLDEHSDELADDWL